VRGPAILDSPTGLLPGDHVSWTFGNAAAFSAAVLAYLDEGRQRGEQLLLLGRSRSELLAAVESLPHRDELLAGGQLEVRTADHDSCSGKDPWARLEAYREEVAAALSRGRTGLRVAADVTDFARRGPQDRLHLVEQLADALMGTTAMTALCLYDASLGEDVLAPVRVLHPFRHRRGLEPLAHLSGRGPALCLAGELDVTQADDVCRALVDVASARGGEVVLDLSELSFLDIAGARALAAAARRLSDSGVQLRFVGARRLARRCLELFGLGDDPA
jgi:anti-anti-sigma factor